MSHRICLPCQKPWPLSQLLSIRPSEACLLVQIRSTLPIASAGDLPTITYKINSIRDHLKKKLDLCYKLIEEKKNVEAYEALSHIFEMVHIDNMKVLRTLIYPKDDLQPLFDGSTKIRDNLEVLRRKNVLLLISSLDISPDELSILEQIYNDSRQYGTRLDNLFEMVWIPIVNQSVQWTEPMQRQFESMQSTMTWYTVHHPSLIDRLVIRFIKERWHFKNKPILVVLDPQGKVVSPNAIHMMWIWGSNAFPFTSLSEEALWMEETWKVELLVNGIDQTILNWIREGKYIFLYGGDDIEWIRRFTTMANSVARDAHIPLEMVYVGKSSRREQVRGAIQAINTGKMGTAWQEPMIWFFWTRLESMLFSKIQLGKADDCDPMMQEIKKLLSYDKSREGWAVFCKGSEVVVNGHGTTVLPTLVEYTDIWKQNVVTIGFDKSFKDHHERLHGIEHPCCRFEFPSIVGSIPESMKCPECLRSMEKHITFICCHDENPATNILD
ncbi:protein SIEVE ELEMENT OCCLUSION B-like isoform X2 [Camellia sinensis]|uniref:protein SIEVE ELEMENT OCCLUSION B-like isoform X2 n=1 Tax=Camellia sinensis TaxID=4442 RepID=UPI001035824E|nr:protein SIEVE ELEMENT OCCLUSION B-like isoform X2 [Camellia sinensis]